MILQLLVLPLILQHFDVINVTSGEWLGELTIGDKSVAVSKLTMRPTSYCETCKKRAIQLDFEFEDTQYKLPLPRSNLTFGGFGSRGKLSTDTRFVVCEGPHGGKGISEIREFSFKVVAVGENTLFGKSDFERRLLITYEDEIDYKISNAFVEFSMATKNRLRGVIRATKTVSPQRYGVGKEIARFSFTRLEK